jgi:hypothetical protein
MLLPIHEVHALRPYQQRVVDERAELDVRREKFENFISGSMWQTLPIEEQDRQVRQLRAMDLYSDVLRERIEAFAVKS